MTIHVSKKWNIQVATIESLDALVALEKACFSVPWSRKNFEAELEGNQFSRGFKGTLLFARVGVPGYAGFPESRLE